MKVNNGHFNYLSTQAKMHGTISGALMKKSGRKLLEQNGGAKWQPRWCIVYANMFFYFETCNSPKPQGFILLEHVQTITAKVSGKICFGLEVPGEEQRQFLFSCQQEDETKTWIDVINNASIKKVLENCEEKCSSQTKEVEVLQKENEKYRREASDQWCQITRLKSKLSTLGKNSERTGSVRSNASKDSGVYGGYSEKDIVHITKVQCIVRSWIVRKNWKNLVQSYVDTFTASNLHERNKLLWQFITAEEDYIKQLDTLVNTFLKPMKSLDADVLTKQQHANLFSTSESLLVLHQIMLAHIDTIVKQWPAVHIDEMLIAVSTSVPIYIDYIKNQPLAMRTLAECKKRFKFLKTMRYFEAKEECHGQTFEQFLTYPTVVIPNYIRNLHAILKVTPLNHSERNSLEDLLSKLQQSQTYNHFLDEAESIKHTLEIERLIDGGCNTLLNASQKFIRHGILKQLDFDGMGTRRERIRHCFLFSHHLIIASRTSDGRLRLSKAYGTIPLTTTVLVEDTEHVDPAQRNCSFTLLVKSMDELSLTLTAAKANDKALWTSDITECIYGLALECTSEESKDIKTQDNKLLSIKDDERLRSDAEDIKYSDELMGPYNLPQILYASVDRLIERLADPRLPGAEYMETLLLTYSSFTDSATVMKGLVEAYWRETGGKPEEQTEKYRSRERHLMLSSSSFSSIDEFDTSFSTQVGSPLTSTSVFNYSSLKEQLNSLPRKRADDTSEWCSTHQPRDYRSTSMYQEPTCPTPILPHRRNSIEVIVSENPQHETTHTFAHSSLDLQHKKLDYVPSFIEVSSGSEDFKTELNNYPSDNEFSTIESMMRQNSQTEDVVNNNITAQTPHLDNDAPIDIVSSPLNNVKFKNSSEPSLQNPLVDAMKRNMTSTSLKSFDSNKYADDTVTKSYSDEPISTNTPPLFRRQHKKLRAVSEPPDENPQLVSIKKRPSMSAADVVNLDDIEINLTKDFFSKSPTKYDWKKRKAGSLFSKSPFRKVTLKRATSEQVLNVSEKPSAPLQQASSMLKINEASEDDSKKSLRKRMKDSLRGKREEQPPHEQQRKLSLFDQHMPNVNRGPLKIMSIIKHWLAKHPKDFMKDSALVKMLEDFFAEIKQDDRTLPVIREIISNLEKSTVAHRQSLATVHPLDLLTQLPLPSTKQSVNKALLGFDARVVAENITLLEHYLYASISFNEFISCQWTKRDREEKAPGIMKFIARFNKMTSMISYSVLHSGDTVNERASTMEWWVSVGAMCRDLNNFNGVMEIVSALNASSVHRLKRTWAHVPRPIVDIFNDLEGLVSAERSFKQLREAVHICNPPCVPYLGCYLSDLLFVQEGGPTFDANKLVNFAKMSRVSRLVREVKCYQQLPYQLPSNELVLSALVSFDVSVDQDSLYERSLQIEPRS